MTKCWLQDEYITSNQNCLVGCMLHGWWTWEDEEHDYQGMEQNKNHEKFFNWFTTCCIKAYQCCYTNVQHDTIDWRANPRWYGHRPHTITSNNHRVFNA